MARDEGRRRPADLLTAPDLAEAMAVVDATGEVLGEDLVGVCLHGSAVLGTLRPQSDLDLLAVSARPPTISERRRLVGALLAISGPPELAPPRPIELTVVIASDVRPWRYPPAVALQYGEWWRAELERGVEPWMSPDPDVTLLVAMARSADTPLVGPSPSQVFDPVPKDDIRRAVLHVVGEIVRSVDDDTTNTNTLLTLARVWYTLATGGFTSKDDAAEWASARLDATHGAVLGHARAEYLGATSVAWAEDRPAVRACADEMLTRVRAMGEGH